jgi:porphobilinogen synthase
LEKEGFHYTQIISYAAKYASHFYGPFREAVGSNVQLNKANKTSYQIDIRNSRDAVLEAGIDIAEGADAIVIKPGMLYLDIIKLVRMEYNIPIIGYQVSGEYSMLKIAAERGVFDNEKAMLESLMSFKRAGANAIITYAATEIAIMIASSL